MEIATSPFLPLYLLFSHWIGYNGFYEDWQFFKIILIYVSTNLLSASPTSLSLICSSYLILTSRRMCEAYMNQAENCLWISDIWNDGWFKKLISSIFMVVIKLFCIITNVESGTWWIWHSNLKHFLKSYFSISLLMNPPAIFLNFHHALTFVTRCSHRCHLTTN